MIYLVLKALGVDAGNRVATHGPSILMETGFYILMEDGASSILLES